MKTYILRDPQPVEPQKSIRQPRPNPMQKFMDPMPAHHEMGTAGKAKGRQDNFTNFDGLVQPRMELTLRCAPVNSILWGLGDNWSMILS